MSKKAKASPSTAVDVDVSFLWLAKGGFNPSLINHHLTKKEPDVLLLYNTGFSHKTNFNLFLRDGYRVLRRDAQDGNGGILIYIKSTLDYEELSECTSDDFESLWIKLSHPLGSRGLENGRDRQKTIVGVAIREHPASLMSFNQHLVSCLQTSHAAHGDDINVLLHVHFDWQNLTEMELSQTALTKTKYSWNVKYSENPAKPVAFLRSKGVDSVISAIRNADGSNFFRHSLNLKYCPYCDDVVTNMDEHRILKMHRNNFFLVEYEKKRPEYVRSKAGLQFQLLGSNSDSALLEHDHGLLQLSVEPGSDVEAKLALKNKGSDKIIVKQIQFLGKQSGVYLDDQYDVTKAQHARKQDRTGGVRLLPNRVLKFDFLSKNVDVGASRIPILVVFKVEGDSTEMLHMILEVLFTVRSKEFDILEPVAPFEAPKAPKERWQSMTDQSYMPGIKLASSKPGSAKFPRSLGKYQIPHDLSRLLMNGLQPQTFLNEHEQELLNDILKMKKGGLQSHSYCQLFKVMIHAEEFQMNLDIRNYDLEKVTLEKKGTSFLLSVPGLAENRPSVLKGDKVFIRNSDTRQVFETYVHQVLATQILLGVSPSLISSHMPGMKFDVEFTVNRYPIQMKHRAVEMVAQDDSCLNVLFPERPQLTMSELPTLSFINRNIDSNDEQKKAVTHIVSGRLRGAPYIIFGPPGTGKTITMVEAIKQIYKKDTKNCRILVCAPSNAATDLLATRLKDTVSKSDIFRLYATHREPRSVPADLLPLSNLSDSNLTYVNKETLMKYKVVVVTLVTAGKIVSMNVPKGHFKQIFIDEAGHAEEPEILIPVSGLLDPVNGQLVLAGDCKQLGPVIRSMVARKLGLERSFKARLMENTSLVCYQKNPETGQHNPNYVTMLLNNFRSNHLLLKIPSQLFYNDELRPKADPVMANSMLNWDELPKKDFPLIMHSVSGVDKRESKSPSFFNVEEVTLIIKYVDKLLTTPGKMKVQGKDIGIISPYRRQIEKIRQALSSKFQRTNTSWRDITIGSTEEFQGQERKVIIVTTVRSREEFLQSDVHFKLGFLRNPKRFNVAITRAKALMIVIGNPNLLKKDRHWRALIEYAISEGGYTGSVKYIPPNQAEEDELTQLIKKMELNEKDDLKKESFDKISEKELQEAPEWKVDF